MLIAPEARILVRWMVVDVAAFNSLHLADDQVGARGADDFVGHLEPSNLDTAPATITQIFDKFVA